MATKGAEDDFRAAASKAVMRSGRHFVQFTVVEGTYIFFSVIRPGGDVEGGVNADEVDGHCFYTTWATGPTMACLGSHVGVLRVVCGYGGIHRGVWPICLTFSRGAIGAACSVYASVNGRTMLNKILHGHQRLFGPIFHGRRTDFSSITPNSTPRGQTNRIG